MAESMYGSRAALYDLLYHWKDYASEAAAIRAILHEAGVADGGSILEAGCGTGVHLSHLREHFDVAGFDLNQGMLAEAARRLPGVDLWRADMREFTVSRSFDAVISLFSCIGYLLDEASLHAAAAAFARAVRPGGCLIVEPWVEASRWQNGRPSLETYGDDDLKLARATVGSRRGDIAVLDMNWLVARRDTPVEHFVDHHELWFCPRETMRATFEEAGFETRIIEPGLGRGLFVGRRR
jgi:daunosaminyl-N,N-dimethyltransferase/N-dimethyltransferase